MSGAITNSISDDAIYNGAWTNWSKGGAIKGATLTLTHRDGGLLTAFLALFVTFAGRSFWRLFCFIAHACLSAGATPQDGLYHQRQAILRNATTGFIGLQYFVQLGWGWRNKALKSWLRIIPLITVTALLVVSFYVAGIFSSQVRLPASVSSFLAVSYQDSTSLHRASKHYIMWFTMSEVSLLNLRVF